MNSVLVRFSHLSCWLICMFGDTVWKYECVNFLICGVCDLAACVLVSLVLVICFDLFQSSCNILTYVEFYRLNELSREC